MAEATAAAAGVGSLSAVVPYDAAHAAAASSSTKEPAWDERRDPAAAPDSGPWYMQLQNALLVLLAMFDNGLCYVAFFVAHSYKDRLYNILEIQMYLLPGLDLAILIFAIVGTLLLISMVALVECMQFPLYHELMNARVLLSAVPAGVCCAIFMLNCEVHEVVPVVSLVTTFCFIFVWCLHMRIHYSRQLNVFSKIALDVSWFLALCFGVTVAVLYGADALKDITNSGDLNCPYVHNRRMPVHILTLDRWYCAKWGESLDISRTPADGNAVQLTCSDSFLLVFGVSIDAHVFECPAGCLQSSSMGSDDVVGCGIYTVDSSVCLAAIHAGALTDAGGRATVYGRVGLPKFARCSRNSIVSSEREVTEEGSSVTLSTPTGGGSSTFVLPGANNGGRRLVPAAPLVFSSAGFRVPQAFHFNNLPDVQEYLWLKRHEEVSARDAGVKANQPWSRIDGIVSARVAGIELDDEQVRLGENEARPLFRDRSSEQTLSTGRRRSRRRRGRVETPECTIRTTGVLCRGAGAAVLELDFCRPELKTCLED